MSMQGVFVGLSGDQGHSVAGTGKLLQINVYLFRFYPWFYFKDFDPSIELELSPRKF